MDIWRPPKLLRVLLSDIYIYIYDISIYIEREKLFSRIEKLKKAGVLFVGINTFPTIEKTWDSIKYAIEIQQRFGVAMVPHITAGNVEEAVLVDMLNTLKEGGVQNIFALVGGMPPKHWLSVTPILDFIKVYIYIIYIY